MFIESQVSTDSKADDSNDYENTVIVMGKQCEAPWPGLMLP